VQDSCAAGQLEMCGKIQMLFIRRVTIPVITFCNILLLYVEEGKESRLRKRRKGCGFNVFEMDGSKLVESVKFVKLFQGTSFPPQDGCLMS